MPYLNVNPMMTALRTAPEEFELVSGWLHHIRSRHSFRFSPDDQVEIRAACNCALLAVRPEQEHQLATCFREWHMSYWRPLEINRDFASHFARRPGILQFMIELTGRVQRWLIKQERVHAHDVIGHVSPRSSAAG
jgi:hypothetical protein